MAWVIWLRAINVGGNNKLPMADLRRLCEDLGFTGVVTYIQSGNVLLDSPLDEVQVRKALLDGIRDRFGLDVPVVARAGDSLQGLLAAHPFAGEGVDPKELHVGFLADLPDPAAVRRLDPDRSPPSRFVVVGREVFLHYPQGIAKTRLTVDWFDRQLGTTLTVRNHNTVEHMAGLAAAR